MPSRYNSSDSELIPVHIQSETEVLIECHAIVESVIAALGLSETVSVRCNWTIVGVECGLLLCIGKQHQIPFAAIEVKKPGSTDMKHFPTDPKNLTTEYKCFFENDDEDGKVRKKLLYKFLICWEQLIFSGKYLPDVDNLSGKFLGQNFEQLNVLELGGIQTSLEW